MAWAGRAVCRRAPNAGGLGGMPCSWIERRGGSGGGRWSPRRGIMGGVESSVGGGLTGSIDDTAPCDDPRRG